MSKNPFFLGSDPDDDLFTDFWAQAKPASAPNDAKSKRGRPKSDVTKVSTTIRLDKDVIEAFKSDGPGWQSRINQALRRAAGL